MAVLTAGLLLLAAALGTEEVDGAVNTLREAGYEVDATTYMISEGLLPAPRPATSPRVECIIWHESRGVSSAVNRRSGASGLGQFLPSTWRSTPQGRAGMSVFDPVANRAAVAWMLSAGRAREFEVVTRGLC